MQKYGFVGRKQRYKCITCGRQFVGGDRLDSHRLWQLYTDGKQTYKQLADQFGCSPKTIQRYLDKHKISSSKVEPKPVMVMMDTTYFGRGFGVMAFKDSYTGAVLYKQYVKYETNQLYRDGIRHLQDSGFEVKGIVCDGRKGLLGHFGGIPMQMCQFHQTAIVTRYLTRKPKTKAAQALREHALLLTKTDKDSFVGGLENWHKTFGTFLNERTTNTLTGRSHYTHKRLRSAYNSLRRNLKWLFTHYDFAELGMPNTTNALDGSFADLKNKLRNHNGLALNRKQRFIDEFFKV